MARIRLDGVELKDHKGRPRVVITGMGAITPLGLTVEELWEGLKEGRSGIGPITRFDASPYNSQIAGEVRGFDPRNYMSSKDARRMARFSQLAVVATQMALRDGGLNINENNNSEVGVILGTSVGSFEDMEKESRTLVTRGGTRISPFFVTIVLANMAAGQVSRFAGAMGYNSTVITACAAGTQAIGEAGEVIRRGAAKVMIAGGTEGSICELGLAAFDVLRALSSRNDEPTKASRPFDRHRNGFVAAEGAGIVILEELEHALRRGALIIGELAGYGCSSDAYHVTAPHPQAKGATLAMRWALLDAGISPEDVDYINAHGTSTPLNDAVETAAIKKVFRDHAYRIPVSSTKSMIGHLLGAAGAVELIATLLVMKHGIIHPTINYETPDPACDLDYVPNVARPARVDVALSNSFGFGGQNACLVVRRFIASSS